MPNNRPRNRRNGSDNYNRDDYDEYNEYNEFKLTFYDILKLFLNKKVTNIVVYQNDTFSTKFIKRLKQGLIILNDIVEFFLLYPKIRK